MSKLRVAVIGVGIYGTNHLLAYSANPNVELVAVCDFRTDRLATVAARYPVKTFTDVETMFLSVEIDAVSVATPDAYHLDPVMKAIRYGKHVLVEKPLATVLGDSETIIQAAEENSVRIAVDYHKRWDPAAINLKNELHKKETGRPIRGYMSMDDVIDVPTKWFDWAHHSSPGHFLGTHCYDLIRWYMECEVTEVYAVGSKGVLSGRGIDTWDTIQAFLTFENGCHWTVENAWILPSGFPKANDGRTQIITENALLRADSQNRGVEFYSGSKGSTPNPYFIIDNNGRPYGFGIEPINDFVDCLIHNKPFIATAQDGLEAEIIADAVHRSLELNQPVNISRQ